MVGPLASYAEPHAYDLCDLHSERLSAPRGWEVLRLAADRDPGPTSDDLLALADAVREAAQPRPDQPRPDQPRTAQPEGRGPARQPVGQAGASAAGAARRSPRPAYDDPPGLIDRTDASEEAPATASGEGVRRGHLRSLRSLD